MPGGEFPGAQRPERAASHLGCAPPSGCTSPPALAARSLPAGGTHSGPTCFPAPVLRLPAPAHNLSRSQAGAAAMELSRPAWKPVRARAQPKQTMPGPRRKAFAPHAPAHGCAALREGPGTRVLQERLLRLSQDRRSSPRTANATPWFSRGPTLPVARPATTPPGWRRSRLPELREGERRSGGQARQRGREAGGMSGETSGGPGTGLSRGNYLATGTRRTRGEVAAAASSRGAASCSRLPGAWAAPPRRAARPSRSPARRRQQRPQ